MDYPISCCVRLHMSIISQDGWSALMCAASEGHTEVITQLLEAGANTDLQDKVYRLSYRFTAFWQL